MVVGSRARAPTSARLSAVSTISPKNCKRPNRARVVQMVRLRKRISIARDNWLTTLTRCVVRWTKEPRAVKGSSRDSNKASRGSPEKRARRVVNKTDGKPVAVNRKLEVTAAGSIVLEQWVATGATHGNCRLRFANGCARRGICDVIGVRLVWAPD